ALQQSGDFKAAIKLFDKAVGKDRKFADAHYAIGLCYMAVDSVKSSINARMRAQYALEDALKIDPENTKYLHALGDVRKKQKYKLESGRIYGNILELDPEDVSVMEKLALFYADQFDQWMYRSERGFSGFAMQEYEGALYMNDRILDLDFKNRGALFRKGKITLEAGDYDTFIEMFKTIIALYDDDKDANLFLGLGYALKGEHDTSNMYYQTAKKLMTPDEREIFESVDYVHPFFDLDLWKMTKTLQVVAEENFWKPKDPLFLTPYNERELEHYGRVAEANLRFSVPERNLPGWKTDRGRIWIRYGRPNRIREVIKKGLFSAAYHKYRYWYYDGFSIEFTTQFTEISEIFELHTRETMEPDFPDEKELFKQYNDLYTYKPKGRMFSFPVDIVQFRGNEDKTDVMVYYSSRLNDIELDPAPDRMGELTGSLKHGVFLFDKDWDKIEEHIDTINLRFNETAVESVTDRFFTLDRVLELDEGEYNLAVELVDPASGNTGTFRGTLIVESFTGGDLQISDILIADNIRLTQPEALPSRENLDILANPYHRFAQKQPVYFYFEIYNLFSANEQDQSRYRIEYSLYPVEEKKGILSRLLGSETEENRITVSSEITTVGSTDKRILSIQHSITDVGEYNLTITITDLRTGQTVEKSSKILIY
ncbi:GWxTD domain-containing protein, partial [candidate division KSB1 bacterium]|nr:GWxTD domain-containing protein [candidate division KSB1 bacterium]